MSADLVLGTEEIRRDLTQVLIRMQDEPGHTVTIGRRRRPEAVLVPYALWRELTNTSPDLRWDPAVGIEYETAESILGDLIGFCAARRWDAQHQQPADEQAAEQWRTRIGDYIAARHELTVTNPAALQQAINHYGAELRDLRRENAADRATR